MKLFQKPITRILSVFAAAALLATVAPSNVHAGDDSATPTKHARQHRSARLREPRHVHYTSELRQDVPTVVPMQVIDRKTDATPLDQNLYRSFQENNLVNPG